jgi:CBS domain-containing protein
MTPSPQRSVPTQLSRDVASILHENGVNSVPVVDADEKVVGMVARADLVRLLARTT